jgi:CHAP domain
MGQNTYASGNCTWWVKHLKDWVPTTWGNAAEWWGHAKGDGFPTSGNPQVGAVAVWGPGIDPPFGFGHVAVVEAVNPDGSFMVNEMNWQGLGKTDKRTVTNRKDLLGFILPPGSKPDSGTSLGPLGDLGIPQFADTIRGIGMQVMQAGKVGSGGIIILLGLVLAGVLVAAGGTKSFLK